MKPDPVRKVKALPKNRNASAPATTYRCGRCFYRCSSVADAWAHSMMHGPWPASDDGTVLNLTPLPTVGRLRYNIGKQRRIG